MNSLPIPLTSAAPSNYFDTPYFFGILAISIASVVLFLTFPSLRKYRRKRNILIYCAIALVLVLLVFQIDNVNRRAFVNFGLGSGQTRVYPDEANQAVLSCQNHGNRAANFYVILKSVNASLQVQTQQNYVSVDSQTVKVPFSLSEASLAANPVNKSVIFTIDERASGFSFSTSLEPIGHEELYLKSSRNSETFVWNLTENCYVLDVISSFT